MKTMDSYKNLIELIKIHEHFLRTYEYNLRLVKSFLFKASSHSSGGGNTSYVDADCIHGGKPEAHEEDWNEAFRLQQLIENEKILIAEYKKAKEIIDNRLRGLEGLEYKVAYLKYVEGYDLQQIASVLGYSYSRISKINMKMKKE